MAEAAATLNPAGAIRPILQRRSGQLERNDGLICSTTGFFVHKGDRTKTYMMTAGHCFRDVDNNRSKKLDKGPLPAEVKPKDQYLGLADADLPKSQNRVYWGRPKPNAVFAAALSADQYHCCGDKINSTIDAGLAQLEPNVAFTQEMKVGKTTRRITKVETTWKLVLDPTEKYYLGAVEVPHAEVSFHDTFQPRGVAWEEHGVGTLFNLMIRRAPMIQDPADKSGTKMTRAPRLIVPGMSGYPLVKAKDDSDECTLVGIVLGAMNDEEGVDVEGFQHISVILTQLNLELA